MKIRLILDILMLGILAICIWSGYKKGLIMGIGGIIIIIVSLFGANLLSNTFSYEIIPVLRPFASGYTEKQMSTTVSDDMGITETGLAIEDYLAEHPDETLEFCRRSYQSLGIYESEAQKMAEAAEDYAQAQDISIREAVSEVLCEKITYAGGFLLAFLLIVIILTVIGNLPNLSFKLPNLDLVNDISGAVCGLVTGILFCAVIAWALQFTGLLFSEESVTDGGVASWFVKWSLLSKYIG